MGCFLPQQDPRQIPKYSLRGSVFSVVCSGRALLCATRCPRLSKCNRGLEWRGTPAWALTPLRASSGPRVCSLLGSESTPRARSPLQVRSLSGMFGPSWVSKTELLLTTDVESAVCWCWGPTRTPTEAAPLWPPLPRGRSCRVDQGPGGPARPRCPLSKCRVNSLCSGPFLGSGPVAVTS